MKVKGWVRGCLVLCAAAAMLGGCAIMGRLSGSEAAASKRAAQLQELQLKVMRFADEYVGGIDTPIRNFQLATDNVTLRLAAQSWKVSQSTAAYTIASAPDPVANALDMVVLATLSRMVMEDTWVARDYGERALPLRDAHRRLEERARDLVTDILTADQLAQLQSYCEDWRRRYPEVRSVASVHFRDFEKAVGPSASSEAHAKGLFSVLGLDPFSNLDPAVREITQTRQLAERSIYYAQRMPVLLQMQVEQLSYQMAAMPETQRTLANADRITDAAAAAGRVADELPAVVAREREAAIKQFMDAINAQTTQMRGMVTELHGMLDAGKGTADSATATIRSLDQLMARFAKPEPAGAPPQPPGRPFDITEYTASAREFSATLRELQTLAVQLDASGAGVAKLTTGAATQLQVIIDHAFWRVVEAILVLVLAILIAAGAYRMWARSGQAPTRA